MGFPEYKACHLGGIASTDFSRKTELFPTARKLHASDNGPCSKRATTAADLCSLYHGPQPQEDVNQLYEPQSWQKATSSLEHRFTSPLSSLALQLLPVLFSK